MAHDDITALGNDETDFIREDELDDPIDHDEPLADSPTPSADGSVHVTIANIRERLAAALIDGVIVFFLYWLGVELYNRVTHQQWLMVAPWNGTHGLIFNGIFLVCVFLYFFLFESIFFATLGKFCCWMSVRRKDGHNPSMGAIFLRNILRPIDHLLIFFPALFVMELTRSTQRIGDFFSRTIVIKKHALESTSYRITFDNLAPATGRLLAGLLDLLFFLAPAATLTMRLSTKEPLLSGWLLLVIPFIPPFLYTCCEVITQTTPGKWLFGYVVATEEGSRIGFANALLRNIGRYIDVLLGGWLLMSLSDRHQRIGDLAGGTLVFKNGRTLRGGIGALVILVIASISALMMPVGRSGPFADDFNLGFACSTTVWNPWGRLAIGDDLFLIRNVRFAVNDAMTARTPAVYVPGETVYILFDVMGLKRQNREVWVQEDLMITYPDGSIGLNQTNVVDYHQVVKSSAPIELTNNIQLPQGAEPGTYTVSITVRDNVTNRQVSSKKTFDVRVKEPELPTKLNPALEEKTPPPTNPLVPPPVPGTGIERPLTPPPPPPSTLPAPAIEPPTIPAIR